MMEEEFQLDPIETAKVSLKTPDDALSYWNHRLEMVRTITSVVVWQKPTQYSRRDPFCTTAPEFLPSYAYPLQFHLLLHVQADQV